jgi:hypothetical protein
MWEGRDMPAEFWSEGKRPLVRPRYRQGSNVDIHIEETELESMDLGA